MSLRQLLSNEVLFDEVVQKTFEVVDLNKSGDINLKEFDALVRQVAKLGEIDEPSDDDIKAIFDKLDLDGSGSIGIEEFKYLVMRIFEIEN